MDCHRDYDCFGCLDKDTGFCPLEQEEKMSKHCVDCEWCKMLTDSSSRDFYICLDTEGGAYMQEVGLCGSCQA